jgi:HTH-type transcriptional regulator/antitoxin HipB
LLLAHRKSAGLTQIDVAKALERPQSFVAAVESGQRRVDVIEFLNFARVSDFDPAAILTELSGVPNE